MRQRGSSWASACAPRADSQNCARASYEKVAGHMQVTCAARASVNSGMRARLLPRFNTIPPQRLQILPNFESFTRRRMQSCSGNFDAVPDFWMDFTEPAAKPSASLSPSPTTSRSNELIFRCRAIASAAVACVCRGNSVRIQQRGATPTQVTI